MNFEMNTPETSAPSISSAAMLAELSISVWTGRKKDKRASDDVTAQSHAAKGVASVNKKLLGDCEELVSIQKFASNVRSTHYASTMPWSDTGMRLLPTAQYFKYHEQMTRLQEEFDRLVQRFLDAYDWEVMQAQTKLGSLFVRDEYPTLDSLRSKFGFRLNYIPVPDAGDWRVDMGNETQDVLKQQYQKFYREQMERAMRDVWQRLHDELSRFIRQLDVDETGRKGKIYQSTMDHLMHLIDMMDCTNFTNDPTLQLAQAKLRQTLDGVDRMDLVRNDGFRANTKRDLEEAIKSLPSLDF